MSSLLILRRWLICATLLVLLSACASVTKVEDPLSLGAGSQLSPVVISITTNTGEVSGSDSLAVYRIRPAGAAGGLDEIYVLKQIATGMSRDTSLFVGSLPPGQYALANLSDSKHNKMLRMQGKYSWIGAFEIRERTPADLGRLLLTPVNRHVVVGRSKLVTSNAALLKQYSPEHARLFGDKPASGWVKAPNSDDMVESYALARPVGADCVTERADGSVLAASRLGTVLIRSTSGRWTAVRSAGLDSLLCVTAADLPDAELLAVGEFGTLLRKAPGDDKLVRIDTGNLPPGSLFGIAGNARSGWFVANQRGAEVTVFHTPRIDSGNWTALRKENVGNNFWIGLDQFWMWPTSDGFAYVTSTGPLHAYHYASGTWSEHKTPGAVLIAVAPGLDNSVGVLTSPGAGFAGIFASVHFSTDQGASWRTVEAPYKIKISPVQQTADGSYLMAGGVMSASELQVSNDQGKTWRHLGPYELGRRLVPLKNGTLVDLDLGRYGIFAIRSSADGGKSWKYEYSNFDRQYAEAERGK